MCNDDKIKSLHIMLPKTSAYVKNYDGQTKWIYFLIEYNVYKVISLKTKIESHGYDVTEFYDKKFLRWTLIILA